MHKTKTALAVEALREAILHGHIKPGERLNVDVLSRELQMSRTPIREAVRILEAEGWIKNEPHRKVTVADLSADDAREVYLLRAHLEGLATQLAVERLSDDDVRALRALQDRMIEAHRVGDHESLRRGNTDWHYYLYRASGTKYLLEFILRLWVPFPWDAVWEIPGRGAKSLQQHEAILEAVAARDAERAGRLMYEHILSGKTSVQQYLEQGAIAAAPAKEASG
ncbi:MAG TPA: GntR family transcriptional regulator [Bacillota bacterium]